MAKIMAKIIAKIMAKTGMAKRCMHASIKRARLTYVRWAYFVMLLLIQ